MRTLSTLQKHGNSSSAMQYDVVVVGAGPYGLSTAAYMLQRGLRVAVFGKPLKLWREHMPQGMLLRSYWWATNIAAPGNHYGLDQYFQEKGLLPFDPLPASVFIDYGLWFQQHLVSQVDETYVERIESSDGGFTLSLVDGRVIQSRSVVMAPGLIYYVYTPEQYNHVRPELISHTSLHQTFQPFAGKRIAIIGGGQSALETAALACESGADVQLITRSPLVWIRESGSFPVQRPLVERLRYPKAGIAPGWFNWELEHFPYVFQRLPRSVKDKFLGGPGRYGPMGAAWLKPRIEGRVTLHELQRVEKVIEGDDGVALTLSNNQRIKADHIILGTGYRVDIQKLPMLCPSLRLQIHTYQGAPILSNRFESSVPGLYFVGFSSVLSCGPLYRFVVGTTAAAHRVAGSVVRQISRY